MPTRKSSVIQGLAKEKGLIKDSTEIKISYDLIKFSPHGKVSMHLVREPRNETCQNCHTKPRWKKRGASFTEFTDIHIAKGIKCVNCYTSSYLNAPIAIHTWLPPLLLEKSSTKNES